MFLPPGHIVSILGYTANSFSAVCPLSTLCSEPPAMQKICALLPLLPSRLAVLRSCCKFLGIVSCMPILHYIDRWLSISTEFCLPGLSIALGGYAKTVLQIQLLCLHLTFSIIPLSSYHFEAPLGQFYFSSKQAYRVSALCPSAPCRRSRRTARISPCCHFLMLLGCSF